MIARTAARLGTIGGALALSACMMPYGGLYEAPPAPAYSDIESPDLYAFIDRADSLWGAIGDAPPDYAFSFDGTEPWAWEMPDGHRIVVEETGDGIESYYFSPGDEGPFLAVRPGMSFGFEGETVAVVYGPDGGAVPRDAGAAHLGEGAERYARGRMLLRAMLQRQWREVDSQAWIDTGPMIWGSVALWDGGWQRHPGWGRHRDRVRESDWRHRLTAERLRREALAEQFRRWREGGFQGPPPGRFHKPGVGRPGRPFAPGVVRPGVDRPRQPGQGGRPPGAQPGRPRPPEAGQPARPWQGRPNRPAPPVVTPDAPGATPVPGAGRPQRPGWGGRPRPERGDAEAGGRGRPQTPPMGGAVRPPRPEGAGPGWFRPRPEGSAPAVRPERGGGRAEGAPSQRPERSERPAASQPRAAPPAEAPRPSPPPVSRPSTSEGVRERRVPDPD
ncbi:hypothetical protein [Sphingomonas sp. LM7]|uniref:hypothetical protein n=1 Tax=Sphingomonas sp. LM7 TaxID=1938607 RepID=UPI000983B502|nr:hypothetical protein [Sphingomonas sp. LM7]AQR73908.1 hypothetical protein BXU08_09840 [Sphingomonas sp. LM7]